MGTDCLLPGISKIKAAISKTYKCDIGIKMVSSDDAAKIVVSGINPL